METKELKVQVPEGYEIDKENSTFERIRFKPIKKDTTYKDICDNILQSTAYSINILGDIVDLNERDYFHNDKNKASNKKQLERLLALNQLLNIAEYYNKLHTKFVDCYVIKYDKVKQIYSTNKVLKLYKFSIEAFFNKEEDAQAVIDNPNFREILDIIYKD